MIHPTLGFNGGDELIDLLSPDVWQVACQVRGLKGEAQPSNISGVEMHQKV